MFLYGSQLSKKIFNDFRNPKDIDWVTNDIEEYNIAIKNKKIGEEIEFIPCSPNREMTADELYTLKFSHAIYDIHWQKTMSDIRFFQKKGCKIDYDYLIKLREFWKNKHSSKRCEFTNIEIFFNDNVNREIQHDELHMILKNPPSYTYIVDGVIPDKEKFDKLEDEIKDNICFEEAYVIAFERFCKNFPPRTSYNKAQQALVTRLHPIWLADYVIENWNKKFWTIKDNYYDIFKTRIN